MSVFHTDACRMPWIAVYSKGVRRDVIRPSDGLDLVVGLNIDNSIWSSPGYFTIDFALIQDGVTYHNLWRGWILVQLPGRPSCPAHGRCERG